MLPTPDQQGSRPAGESFPSVNLHILKRKALLSGLDIPVAYFLTAAMNAFFWTFYPILFNQGEIWYVVDLGYIVFTHYC